MQTYIKIRDFYVSLQKSSKYLIKMIIEEFSFGNFRSFKDIQTLRMSAAKITSKNKELDEQNVIPINDKTSTLKSKVIYGANASGKTNVYSALFYFHGFIDYNLKSEAVFGLLTPFFYSTETLDEPTFFQMIFWDEGVRYRYGFEADRKKIHSEWLYLTSNIREVCVFQRDGQVIEKISEKYMPQGYQLSNMKAKLFTDKILFLSLADNFSDALAEKVVSNIKKIIFYSCDSKSNTEKDNVHSYIEENNSAILQFLKYADTGISHVKLTVDKDGDKEKTSILSGHYVYDKNLNKVKEVDILFDGFESAGTKEILSLSPDIIESLGEGCPLIIDEFGSKLHPMLTKQIFSLYNSAKNTNAQIIAITHTTELMSSDLLRKDQIDFVEKDKYGSSYLYSLAEIKDVRNTASFESDYLKGKYGAIPFLGKWEELLTIADETTGGEDE